MPLTSLLAISSLILYSLLACFLLYDMVKNKYYYENSFLLFGCIFYLFNQSRNVIAGEFLSSSIEWSITEILFAFGFIIIKLKHIFSIKYGYKKHASIKRYKF